MKPKIIYLCYIPLIEKLENDFYMNDLIREGFSIEYWDLSKIFFPNIEFHIKVDRPFIVNIRDYEELDRMIIAQDIINCLFIVMVVFNGMVIKLYRLLKKYDCFLIYFDRSGIPTVLNNDSLYRKAVNKYRNCLKIGKLKEKWLSEVAKLNKKIGLIKDYDLVFAAGSIEALKYGTVTEVVPINHFDYDQYLCLKDNRDRLITGEYCVFLDDNLIDNYDFKINKIKTIKPAPYFNSICNLFDCIENKFNLQVVIAAHPKSDYRGNDFGNRCIIKNKVIDHRV